MAKILFVCMILSLVLISQTQAAHYTQTSIRNINYENGTLEARVEGKWTTYHTAKLPDKVLKWNFDKRLEALQEMMTNPNAPKSLTGPHSGMVASHGATREDSLFSINVAVKGMGFLPKKDKIKGIMADMRALKTEPINKKIQYLIDLYKKGSEVFDLDKQLSIELYTTESFKTHTFLNCMEDPGVSIVFLDFPSYEIRAITYLLDPNNPNLTSYERDAVDYVNQVHSFFHGNFSRMFIGVIYFNVEAFDDTPGTREGRGQKIP